MQHTYILVTTCGISQVVDCFNHQIFSRREYSLLRTSMIEGEKVQELQVRKAEEELKQAEQLKKQKISEEMRWGDRQSDWRPGVSGGDRGLKMARENWRGENKSESRIIQIRKRFPGQNSMNQANLRRVK